MFFLPSKFPDLSKKKIGVKILEILGVFPKLLNQNVLNQHVQEKSPSTFQPLNLVWIYIELRLLSLLINYDEAVPALEGWPHAGLGQSQGFARWRGGYRV